MSPKKINPRKASTLENLKDLVSRAKSIAVVDYKGLKVNQATELRRTVKKAGGEVIVTKNTLFSLALKTHNSQLEADLTGPSAFIFSLTDEVSAVKAVSEFAKKNLLPTFKLGFLDNRLLDMSEISALAALPSKEVLAGQLVGSLKSPLYRLAYGLNWNILKLVQTLDAVRVSKSN
jgi:large subunit ribosomal protein L10